MPKASILAALSLLCLPASLRAQGNAAPGLFPHPWNRFYFGAQVNFIDQRNAAFPAEYSGPNSFGDTPDNALSRVVTVYTAAQLDPSTEIVFDLEETGGSGLSSVLGLAAEPDLDAVRNPSLSKAPYLARLFVHKVFGWGTGTSDASGAPLSTFTHLPAHRIELRAGKFSLADWFDVNSVGSDSHLQFMNWTVDNNGAWDYAANTRGYTEAAMVEVQSPEWGTRFAEALMPTIANGIDLEWNLRRARAENFEAEWHPTAGVAHAHAMVVRLLIYDNHGNMGVYRVAIANFLAGRTPTPDVTAHPRQFTSKPGAGLNFEAHLAAPLAVFARLGWADGRYESFAYTEVERTAATGATLTGDAWGRPNDKLGAALVVNAISGDHRRYLQLGGLGFLLGDGNLNYAPEKAVESFYTFSVGRGLSFAPDLQFVADPGYNQARGPIWIASLRAHVDF